MNDVHSVRTHLVPAPLATGPLNASVQFRLRVYRQERVAVGPGKVALLEAIAETGSISAAARRYGMSYRRAWLLVDEMNRALREPAVATAVGGASGGGARLTTVGEEIVRRYRHIEALAYEAAADDLAALAAILAPGTSSLPRGGERARRAGEGADLV